MLCFYQALAFRTALSHLRDCDPTEALEKQEKDAQLAYEKGTKACVICHPLQMISMIICSCSSRANSSNVPPSQWIHLDFVSKLDLDPEFVTQDAQKAREEATRSLAEKSGAGSLATK